MDTLINYPALAPLKDWFVAAGDEYSSLPFEAGNWI